MNLNERLQELRKSKGLSQKQLCDLLQFKRSTYNEWEQGRRTPDIYTLIILADYYRISLDEIVGREPLAESRTAAEMLDGLPEEALRSLEDYIALLRQRYGGKGK